MSNAQKKNVPELRFSGFEGEWEEKKLGEVTTQSMYGIGASATSFDSKNIYVRITDIDEKSRKLNYQNLTTPDVINNKYKLKRNDILFARTGASTGKSYIHKGEKDIYNYYFAGFLIKFEINEQNSPLFIYQFTLTSKFNNWVKVMSVRSGQPGINSEEYAKLPLVLPNKLEQQKIGQFFSKLDRQIELEEQKLELLQQQKKGYMQKIFSQELRFKDENGEEYPEWEEKQLGEVAEIIGGGTPSTKNKLYWNGEINWFSPIEIGNKTYVYSSQKKITEEGLRKSSAKILPVGTILFTSRAGIGKTAILAKESTTNQGFQSIVPRKGVLDSYYVYTISNILKILAEKVSAGSTFSEISKKQMEQLNLNIPMIKEQKNISKFFSKFDNLIEIQERKLKLLKQQKQGLLQKMFI
ncbi:restriction endonuclease subunit S [Staphylococcus aureus]|uniref:restriction endonuclease subunit S n=1 Tax=Staphylococcus aureus TaxID=1280 RepID=UPI001887DFD4|nr:restriction endonuclease subunit S [Staphylococcus aureus]MDE5042494.1 restriction endonuclease subunit S [Staphylococcus aureus]QOW91956.1 restriction endonuclease subunit S [Staphylococcus aureus]QOY74687.1 restriction endonuclease subunit S [Staphylococcus aureus]